MRQRNLPAHSKDPKETRVETTMKYHHDVLAWPFCLKELFKNVRATGTVQGCFATFWSQAPKQCSIDYREPLRMMPRSYSLKWFLI